MVMIPTEILESITQEGVDRRAALVAENERLLTALTEIVRLAGRNGPPNELDALNEIERIARAELHVTTPPRGTGEG